MAWRQPVTRLPPLSLGRRPTFRNEKSEVSIHLILPHDLIACFADEIGDIDRRERIGATHLQPFADIKTLEGLARLQHGQRAFEPRQIKQGDGHG